MATQILGKVAYTSRGAYDSSFSYEINDVVTYNGSSYVSKKETKGNLPTNEEYWMLLAEKGATYQVTEEDLKNIANEITADANSVFNQNVTSKTNAFDANASSQTSAFNENAEKSITAFDNNANAKTTSYNNNATSALSAYNTNHNEKVEAYNTNANTKLEEFNTNASSYDERITDNTNRTKRIENTLYDSGEASGTSINIKDSTLAEFQEISVDGVCKQTTTDGYNLIKDEYIKSTGVENKPNTELLKSGVYTLAMCDKIAFDSPIYIRLWKNGEMVATDSHITNINNWSISGFSNVTYNYYGTALSGTNYISFNIDDEYELEITTLNASGTRRVTLVSGDKPIYDFEPYSGGVASPSPSYPQNIEVIDEDFEVKSIGKNLLDTSNMIKTITKNGVTFTNNGDGTFNVKGTAEIDTTFSIVRDLPKDIIKSGEKNCLYSSHLYDNKSFNYSLILNTDNGIKYYVANKIVQSDFNEVNSVNLTLYIPAGQTIEVENVKTALYKSDTVINEYEPYQETRVPINLPDGEFVGKINEDDKDQIRLAFNEENGEYKPKLSKTLGRDVLDGSEYWQLVNSTSDYYEYQAIISSKPALNNYTFAISTHFSNKTNNRIVMNDKVMLVRVPASENITTVDEFKNYLSENNVEYFYQLAEPYEVDLGEVDMPLSYSPETNVFTTSDLQPNINAKYYRNFINTIQNLQVNEKALKDELVDIQSKLNALMINVSNLSVLATNDEVESESEE